ncbi:HNH endonuclease [Stenotrophomonas lactitubi]|uniref:HNH endonuclease n=1 Tax=Stenotrophomonas lactitubi TaxID=2045214 RepID=UPI003D1749D9
MTGCDAVDALEAAHIIPYRNKSSNAISNGLLLRADVHTLFDLYLIGADADSGEIAIAPALRNSMYGELHGARLTIPCKVDRAASSASLIWHRSRCLW